MKHKISLSNRKQLEELQEQVKFPGQTRAKIRREQIKYMCDMHIIPESKLALIIEQMTSDITIDLKNSYEEWCQPLDHNRFHYSPNERNEKLLRMLKMILIDIADWLITRGFKKSECCKKCQEISNNVTKNLRELGIPVNNILLRNKTV